jgi:hypothetical protein
MLTRAMLMPSLFPKAAECQRVICVNPDVSRTVGAVADDLGGWGLPRLRRGCADPAAVDCALVDAVGFSARVLGADVEVDRRLTMATLRERCRSWIAPAKVRRMRTLFALPPKLELGAVAFHRFGASRVSVGEVFDSVARLNAESAGAAAAAGVADSERARKRKLDV